MADLRIDSTKNSPSVNCLLADGKIEITGNSFPENARKFYNVLIDWLKNNASSMPSIEINADINYMASSSLISFLDFLKQAEKLFGEKSCVLNWNYEDDDDDALKIGQDFAKIVSMKINLLPY